MTMLTIATFRQSCFMSWRTPALHEVQLKQRLLLFHSEQSGSADDAGVPVQFVALSNVKSQLEGGLQHPDCNQSIKKKKKSSNLSILERQWYEPVLGSSWLLWRTFSSRSENQTWSPAGTPFAAHKAQSQTSWKNPGREPKGKGKAGPKGRNKCIPEQVWGMRHQTG